MVRWKLGVEPVQATTRTPPQQRSEPQITFISAEADGAAADKTDTGATAAQLAIRLMSDEAMALRLSALEQEIARLRAELTVQHRGTPTLRQQGACPACSGRRFLHAPTVLDRADGGPSELALAKPSIWRSRVFGVFEAYACIGCGWVEWYVKDPASLEELPNKKEGFVIVDTSTAPKETPYR